MRTVSEFLRDKTLFVTGATGFLGQSLVEKILWSVPDVGCIYVLIRAQPLLGGRVRQAQERLERELFQSSCFDRLRGTHGDGLVEFLSEKLVAVPGDLANEDLGLEPELRSRLQEEIDVFINSAAVVSFDAPLDEALELNVLGAGRVARFARSCSKCVFIHVSTAYVCGAATDSIPESLYHTANQDEEDAFSNPKVHRARSRYRSHPRDHREGAGAVPRPAAGSSLQRSPDQALPKVAPWEKLTAPGEDRKFAKQMDQGPAHQRRHGAGPESAAGTTPTPTPRPWASSRSRASGETFLL